VSRDSLVLENLTVRYQALVAVREASAVFEPNSIVGLIGPNGAGKTTLLNAISGFTDISSGRVLMGDKDMTKMSAQARVALGVVRSFQTVRLLEEETVFLNVALGCERSRQPTVVEQILDLPRQWRVRRRDLRATEEVLEILGLSGVAHRPAAELPYATRRLIELARILVVHPEIVLLDEPAAGSDRTDRELLGKTLHALHARDPFTMIVVEHDVDVVRKLCSHAIAMDSGRVIAAGVPEAVLQDPKVREAYFGVGHSA
jgi:branched-chain amino acid transport system ATP-binding protein